MWWKCWCQNVDIWAGRCFDFAGLLHSNYAPHYNLPFEQHNDMDALTFMSRPRRQVRNIAQWCRTFEVFMAVLLRKPVMLPFLQTYLLSIHQGVRQRETWLEARQWTVLSRPCLCCFAAAFECNSACPIHRVLARRTSLNFQNTINPQNSQCNMPASSPPEKSLFKFPSSIATTCTG